MTNVFFPSEYQDFGARSIVPVSACNQLVTLIWPTHLVSVFIVIIAYVQNEFVPLIKMTDYTNLCMDITLHNPLYCTPYPVPRSMILLPLPPARQKL
jgi:hypothetical protein